MSETREERLKRALRLARSYIDQPTMLSVIDAALDDADGFVLVPARRIDELLEANNRYLEEARTARAELQRVTRDLFAASTFNERLTKLEAWAHEPFDFTHLIARLERLEASNPVYGADNG